MERLAKALIERLLQGSDILEIEERPPLGGPGYGRRWRIRLITPGEEARGDG